MTLLGDFRLVSWCEGNMALPNVMGTSKFGKMFFRMSILAAAENVEKFGPKLFEFFLKN